MTEYKIIITHGSSEHDCIKRDDGSCALNCPNYTRKDGFTQLESVVLHLPYEPLYCAVLGGTNPKVSQLEDL